MKDTNGTKFMILDFRAWIALISLCLLAGVFAGNDIFAQDSTPSPEDVQPTACQLYHLTVPEARVRSCAGFDCPVIAGVTDKETLCIRGVADHNVSWAIIDLEPDNPESDTGYISGEVIAPGAVGVDPSPYSYCDAWQVNVPEAVVRQCPETSCAALGELPEGEQICATDYRGLYIDWALLESVPGQGEEWIDRRFLAGAEGDEFCDAWRVIDAGAVTRECPDINCGMVRRLAINEEICVIGEDDDDLEWISFNYNANTTGWLYAGLLKKIEDVVEDAEAPVPFVNISAVQTEAVQITPNPSEPSNLESRDICYYYTVSVFSAVVRSRPTFDAAPLTTVPRGARICVKSVVPYLERDWFVVDLNPSGTTPSEGFMHQSLLIPEAQPAPVITQAPASPQSQDMTQVPLAESETLETPGIMICPPQAMQPRPFDGRTEVAVTSTPFPPDYCITPTPTSLLEPPPTQVASQALLSQDITLAALNVRNIELKSPQESAQFRLFIPDDWNPIGSSVLYLNLEYFESFISQTTAESTTTLATQLEIRLDDVLISSVTLTSANVGVQTLAIPLPADILANPDRRSHRVDLSLDARSHCEASATARIFSRSAQSFIHFEYNEFLPMLDLARHPRPFYNNRPNNEVESVLLVLPPNPSAADMQVAANIAAGFGLLTYHNLDIRVSTADVLTEQERESSNLVLVGTIGTNRLIDNLYEADLLPTSLSSSGELVFRDTALDVNDGVVQLIAHPENPKWAIMVITGQTEEGLVKAGQALAGPPSTMGLGGTVAIISSTQPLVRLSNTNRLSTLLKLYELGFDQDIVVNGVGTQIVEVDFDFPLGVQLAEDAYVDILFNNSAALEGPQTTFTVLVNDIPIASTVLNVREESDTSGLRRLRTSIPPSVILPGAENTLTLVVDTQEAWNCNPPGRVAAWLAISNQSEIYLPRTTLPSQSFNPLVAQFPVPFNATPNLSDVWISLPATPSLVDITSALKLISRLASSTINGEGLVPKITTSELPDDTDQGNYHFIIIGRPTTNPFLNQINDYLPQPFVEGTDELQQVLDDVTYRLLPGFEIGILQTLHSPWAENKAILVITGTSDLSQANAINALTGYDFGRSELAGNVVFATGSSVSAIDTSTVYDVLEILEAVPDLISDSQTATLVPTATPIPVFTVTPLPTAESSPTEMNSPTPFSTAIVGTTVTPVPPTPVPTLEPISIEDLSEVDQPAPKWADALIILSIIATVLVLVYGLFRLIRSTRG